MYCTRPTRSPPGPNRAENTSTIFITISLGVAGRIWVVWAWYYGPEPNWPMLSPRSFGGVDKSYPKSAFSYFWSHFHYWQTNRVAARKHTEKQGAGLQIYRELMELSILCSVYVCAYTTEERKVTSSKRKKLLHFIPSVISSFSFSVTKFFSKRPVRKSFAQL